jgi:hypothetical protein
MGVGFCEFLAENGRLLGSRRRIFGAETPIFCPFLLRKLLFGRRSANAAESREWERERGRERGREF